MKLFHGSKYSFSMFRNNCHFGTYEQAMKIISSRNYMSHEEYCFDGEFIYEIKIRKSLNFKMVRDQGQGKWSITKYIRLHYDGIKYKNGREGEGWSYLIFDKKNIKIESRREI